MRSQPWSDILAGASGEPAPLLELQDVDKWYPQGGARFRVLRRVTLAVRAGEFVTLMGPPAAGKSTLLAILGLQDQEWSGSYRVFGRAVHDLGHPERERLRQAMGFASQNGALLADLTVFENVEQPLTCRGVGRAERDAQVGEALARFGLAARGDLYPPQLSGAQRQLAAIARAVIGEPKLVLVDEPTGTLPTGLAGGIMAMFQRLNARGTTIVQAAHSEAIAAFGRRVIRIQNGAVVADGPPPVR